jgi:hypothetical protein
MNSQVNRQMAAIGAAAVMFSICTGLDAKIAQGSQWGPWFILGLAVLGVALVFASCKNRGRGNPAPYSALTIGNVYEVIHFQQDISDILILNRSGRRPEGEPLLISDRGFPPVLKAIGRRFEKTEQSHKIIC